MKILWQSFCSWLQQTMPSETVYSTINFFPSLTSYRQSHFMLEKKVITADHISHLSLFSRSSSWFFGVRREKKAIYNGGFMIIISCERGVIVTASERISTPFAISSLPSTQKKKKNTQPEAIIMSSRLFVSSLVPHFHHHHLIFYYPPSSPNPPSCSKIKPRRKRKKKEKVRR